jgi:hypothetical protein
VRLLLDECVDRGLAREIAGHEVTTVPDAGWASAQNGELLALAQKRFDAFITTDRNLAFQQRLANFSIAIVILRARTNRLADLRPLVPKLLQILPTAKRGEVTWVEI